VARPPPKTATTAKATQATGREVVAMDFVVLIRFCCGNRKKL